MSQPPATAAPAAVRTGGTAGPPPGDPTRGGPAARLPDLIPAGQVLALVGYAAAGELPGAAALRGWLLTAVVLAGAVACALAGAREKHRGLARTAWQVLAAAHVALAGSLVWAALVQDWSARAGVTLPGPSYLVYYPPVLVASALLVRDRTPRWLPGMWWDAVTVALGAGAAVSTVLWLLRPDAGYRNGSGAGLLAPAADAVLLTAILVVASLSGARLGPGPWWLTAGLSVVALADVAHLHEVRAGGAGQAVDVARVAGFVLVGLAARSREGVWTPVGPAAAPGTAEPADRRHHAPANPSGVRGRRPALLPAALVTLAVGVVGWALVGGPVPRESALLGLSGLAVALLRSLTVRGGRRPAPTDPHTDALTGLANRQALAEALAGESTDGRGHAGWAGWPGGTERVSLLLVDIDRFKDINEALGHETGDRVLAEVGARLRGVLREAQLLARLGGDEFAVLLPGADEDAARRVADLLRRALVDPIETPRGPRTGGIGPLGAGPADQGPADQDGTPARLHVRASVGIATCPLRRGLPQDLLRQADVAVARAKTTGTGVAVFDPERDRIDTTRLRRTDELRAALDRGDLEVHLQPQVDLAKGTVIGAEALARWRHPQDGVLLPASFLPLAARTGLLRPVAAVVLDRAMAACARWWHLGYAVPVSVNVTADDLRDPQLTLLLEQGLDRHGLPAAAVRVEITEDALLADPPAAARLLQRWRSAGVRVSLDDFGTGYSSLAYLRDLPLDELKLDKAFVTDLRNRTTATIVRHTVAMAHALRLQVVGEGVEDAATARVLADTGCDVGQGLYFGDAMDVDQFLAHLQARRP